MKTREYKTGVTLIEMLIVVAVITILAATVVTVTRYVSSRSEINLAEGSIVIVEAALEQFADYGYRYTGTYSQFKFPLDCNGLDKEGISEQFSNAVLNVSSVTIEGGVHLSEYSGSEILYFFLNQVPVSRETISKLDSSLITNKGANGEGMFIELNKGSEEPSKYSLYRIIV